jgi:hypothetical protein
VPQASARAAQAAGTKKFLRMKPSQKCLPVKATWLSQFDVPRRLTL